MQTVRQAAQLVIIVCCNKYNNQKYVKHCWGEPSRAVVRVSLEFTQIDSPTDTDEINVE